MRKFKVLSFYVLLIFLALPCRLSAQDKETAVAPKDKPAGQEAVSPVAQVPLAQVTAGAEAVEPDAQEAAAEEAVPEGGVSTEESYSVAPGNVTLDFKDADILNVLKMISFKSGINIVTTPDVIGNVTIRLADVPWQVALDVLLRTYGFGSQRQSNIVLVTRLDNIAKIQAEEVLQTEILNLKFLDAQDAQKILIPLLSPRGKISVLYARGQKGWRFGTFRIGRAGTSSEALQREAAGDSATSETVSIEKNIAGDIVSKKAEFTPSVKSKTIIITDTAASLDRIRNVILPGIDKKPQQVLIETRIMEVSKDKLKDIGIDYGTGSGGAHGYTTAPGNINVNQSGSKVVAGRNLASEFTPALFGPLEGTTAFTGKYPYSAGLELIFKHLTGDQFEVILHALEEDALTNTLSAPRILTLDNQEASILVGYHTPILSSSLSAGTSTEGPTQTQTLDYYQEIGIRLNVVPQISENGYVNMIIHPSVTSSSSNVRATNVAGTGGSAITTTVEYPIIDVREAQTQVLMKDGETIVLGGLLKDVKSKEVIGIPILKDIPYLGKFFRREITDTNKIDLLIFISARIVKDDEFTPEQIAEMESQLGKEKKGVVAKKLSVKD